MILKNFKNLLCLIILLLFSTNLISDEKIDIWKNQNNTKTLEPKENKTKNKLNSNNLESAQKILSDKKITIQDGTIEPLEKIKVFGIYDPEEYNFNLNMWSSTNADDFRSSLKRLKKIKLSETSNEILTQVLLSFSHPPKSMSDDEFADLKINWIIENERIDLVEEFLKQNKEFKNKKKAVQFLVNEKISQANIKEGCEKIKFIDTTIKDSYLEKFKIYCLVFNEKKSQARLLLDLLREQKQSDQFFDDKINFLLGISDKTSNKINEKNLLNFYLSSVTIKDFKYEPTKKTKNEIWKYLNAANLIKVDDIADKVKIKELEEAVNNDQVEPKVIFDTYQKMPFNLKTLIDAKNVYQSLDEIEARALIYQKYLLSEDIVSKLEYLFLLEDLFNKNKLQNIFSAKLSESLEEIGLENMPDDYKELAMKKIQSQDELNLGKIKFNDKVLHQSKIMKFYLEDIEQKKIQKDIDRIFKKINKNRKYFYSAKDLALVDALDKDGFKIPETFKKNELAEKYDVPKNLLQLIEKEQNAFVALKIVEIIGEDEPHQLDPETIYFIINLLNEMDLIEIRNKVLISALPLRV